MQKLHDPCIKTNTFAKLCNTNKRTLIHYDDIGLFSPAYTDQNGYRYYSENQCDVFFTITCLKDLGMPLKEIKAYIDNRSPDVLKGLLLQQQERVRKELEHLTRIRQVIETKLSLVNTGSDVQFHGRCSDVILESCQEELLIVSPQLNCSAQKPLFSALSEHIRYCSEQELNIGHPYGAMIPVSSLLDPGPDIYAYFFTKIDISSQKSANEHPHLKKEAGTYAVIYLKGDYYESGDAYKTLMAFIHKNQFVPGEYCYKEAIWDELTVQDTEEYITKISIPII